MNRTSRKVRCCRTDALKRRWLQLIEALPPDATFDEWHEWRREYGQEISEIVDELNRRKDHHETPTHNMGNAQT
jgi:hypothetical protein